ncbi:MAG: hypothetical protein XD82_1635 [Methanoculleus marisnigri]|jgi:hypothetical protein|uniref:Uncharacterized protein n=1 Tax=Methanoculleus marisnigri TaxID=2198 RepID=A0A101GKZ4_9EURY|nr:MAG: hypothetical protein XD82_1635 [Methanoculleus marisnigri]
MRTGTSIQFWRYAILTYPRGRRPRRQVRCLLMPGFWHGRRWSGNRTYLSARRGTGGGQVVPSRRYRQDELPPVGQGRDDDDRLPVLVDDLLHPEVPVVCVRDCVGVQCAYLVVRRGPGRELCLRERVHRSGEVGPAGHLWIPGEIDPGIPERRLPPLGIEVIGDYPALEYVLERLRKTVQRERCVDPPHPGKVLRHEVREECPRLRVSQRSPKFSAR